MYTVSSPQARRFGVAPPGRGGAVGRCEVRDDPLRWTERGPESCHMPDRAVNARFVGSRRRWCEIRHWRPAHGGDGHLERDPGGAGGAQPHQVAEPRAYADLAAAYDTEVRLFDRDALQVEIRSPVFLAGLLVGPEQTVMLDPARLARGLKQAG